MDERPRPKHIPPFNDAPYSSCRCFSSRHVHAAIGGAKAELRTCTTEPAPTQTQTHKHYAILMCILFLAQDRLDQVTVVCVCVHTCVVVLGSCVVYWMEWTVLKSSAALLWSPCSGSAVSKQQQQSIV